MYFLVIGIVGGLIVAAIHGIIAADVLLGIIAFVAITAGIGAAISKPQKKSPPKG